MCAHVNPINLITLAEIRREELLAEAEHYRLVNQATNRGVARRRHGSDLRAAVQALGARVNSTRWPDRTKSNELARPAAPETT